MSKRTPDWRDTIGQTIRDASARGLSAADLARIAVKEVARGDTGATAVKSAFAHAFGISYRVSRAISHWREFNQAPNQLSDEEFELMMAPWIEAGGEPDWSSTVVEVLRTKHREGLRVSALAAVAEEHLGPNPAHAKIALFYAFDVPMSLLLARHWRGWNPGPDAMSDEEFDEFLEPWI